MTSEEKFFIDKIRKKTGLAINRYNMAGQGDRIAAAVSGGKDSLVMLDIMAERRKYIPIHYEILALHVSAAAVPYEIDRGYIEEFCSARGVELHFKEIDFELSDDGSACAACAINRRNAYFRFMEETACGRLALGHNRDDLLETFLMNMIYQGNISTMPPRLDIFEGRAAIIRPLYAVSAGEIKRYAGIMGFRGMEAECPYRDSSKRSAAGELLAEMERLNPGAAKSIFRAMGNVKPEYLP